MHQDECRVMSTAPPTPRRDTDAKRFQAVMALAERYHYEREHTHQVTRLALAIFDELGPVYGYGEDERFWLQCAAMLHDIGWTEGRKGHHKTAQRLILAAADLLEQAAGRRIVIDIVRDAAG